jgi:hypothetical protein
MNKNKKPFKKCKTCKKPDDCKKAGKCLDPKKAGSLNIYNR